MLILSQDKRKIVNLNSGILLAEDVKLYFVSRHLDTETYEDGQVLMGRYGSDRKASDVLDEIFDKAAEGVKCVAL